MIETEQGDAVAVIRYSNPPSGTIGGSGASELLGAVDAALAAGAVRAVVLTGSGNVFIRHYHLASIEKSARALRAGAVAVDAIAEPPFARLIRTCSESPKPVIAAINGTCMGGGFELALACDIRIACERVQHIGLPEIRAGIFPGGGGTVRLPRLIGEARAREFLLRGRVVDAATARDMGLVHDVAPDALELALERAAELVSRPPAALATIKRMAGQGLDLPLAEAVTLESRAFYELLRDDDEALATLRRAIDSGVDLGEMP